MNFNEFFTRYLLKRDAEIANLKNDIQQLKKHKWLLDHQNHRHSNPSCPECDEHIYHKSDYFLCRGCDDVFKKMTMQSCEHCALNFCNHCIINYKFTCNSQSQDGALCISCFKANDTIICYNLECNHLLISDNDEDTLTFYCRETFGKCEECDKIFCVECANSKTYKGTEHNLCLHCDEYYYWCPGSVNDEGHETHRKEQRYCDQHNQYGPQVPSKIYDLSVSKVTPVWEFNANRMGTINMAINGRDPEQLGYLYFSI